MAKRLTEKDQNETHVSDFARSQNFLKQAMKMKIEDKILRKRRDDQLGNMLKKVLK